MVGGGGCELTVEWRRPQARLNGTMPKANALSQRVTPELLSGGWGTTCLLAERGWIPLGGKGV